MSGSTKLKPLRGPESRSAIDSVEAARILSPDDRDGIDHEVQLHDETLRDGEQTVGVTFSIDDKVELAEKLVDAGLKSITAGFPAISENEREAARQIAKLGDPSYFWAFCRAVKGDIDAARSCNIESIGMFVSISDSHLHYKLGLDIDAAYDKMVDSIRFARSHGMRVRFGFEDASRAPLERVVRFAVGAVEAGAVQISVGDTVGILTPLGARGLFAELRRALGPGIPLYTHFHDDLGMATANSVMAAIGGANYVMASLCGLGERAGNACHEEVAVALRVQYGVDCGVDLAKLVAAARRASEIARFPIAVNKPILGRNVFSHESGIHVHGLMRERSTYEPFPPELVGSEHRVFHGKHAGLSNVAHLAMEMGVSASDEVLHEALAEIKARGERGEAPTNDEARDILRRALESSSA